MSETTESKRPRTVRITWLLGGATLLAAAVFFWITLGPPTMNDRALKRASEAADVHAHEAVGRLVTAARESDFTDARISRAMALSTAGVRSIRRLDSVIVVTAEVHAVTSGAFGTLSADRCYEYEITLPVQNDSSIRLHELPSC
ncbi:hypothetical protein [Amycolatopsis sp. DG1A-15b]|uniref:hypothetical protein n=1 Tax=Amycolatopsis sp. DG1A-15b TaxID=3052846 RepID=UPI00255B9293|nr:hypothetical protein [Amycolatopsis sp. DG1A-15b]WIX86354.1 hypothetical protein QRY02_34920 [Amycolatopsis sp. DG1A-15b]